MRVLVIGAGRMGRAAAWDLARQPGVKYVMLVDRDREALAEARKIDDKLQDGAGIQTSFMDLDNTDIDDIRFLMKDFDAVLSSADYRFNELLTKAALAARVHMCDLGGNLFVVEKQLALSSAAKDKNVTIIPDCGLAPGMAGLLAAWGIERMSSVDNVKLRVGGLPAHPKPPLNYKLVFSVRGLINEYLEPAEVIRNSKIERLQSLTDIEELVFPLPFGRMEAFNTSGGSSTLPQTFQGKVKNLDYKTIRYPGHAAAFAGMHQIGLLSDSPVDAIVPRIFTEKMLENSLTDDDTDVVLMRVTVSGILISEPGNLVFELIDYHNPETGHSAMARTTAYSAATVAYMLASGEIQQRGVLPGEIAVPLESFVNGVRDRGLDIVERWEPKVL